LAVAEGPEAGKNAFGAMLEEATHLIRNFGFSAQNAIHRTAAMRGALEPYQEWRQGRIEDRTFLDRLS